jgi:nucleotide-binding universal stress UspA family protein
MTNCKNVVVGVDGSPDAERALRWAAEYAREIGADLTLVTVWQWPMSFGIPMAWQGWDPAVDAEQVSEKAAAELTLPSERVHLKVECGDPGDVLVDSSRDAAVLVVGTRGHGALAATVLGSVSHYAVHHAECAVVVVR